MAITVIFVFTTPALATGASKQQMLIDKARITFESFMIDKNMAWFREHMHEAKGFMIIPSLLKGGFIIGGSGGKGVLIVKNKNTDRWSQPAFYTIGSVTLGLQIGGEMSEIIMVVRTQKGIDSLLASSFKLGGDASIAVGPVGGGAKSDILTDFISYVRSEGAFVGVSLEGAVISTNDKWNKAYYGKAVTPVDILVKKSVSNPGSAPLRETVQKAFK